MKYKLLSIENRAMINIGDYVQALAAAQFLPQVDGFVNRECLSDYDGDECKVIMNGWYMHDPTKWPPGEKITPLFVALHINKLASEQMLQEKGRTYLKKHEPIGCRDYHTRDLLQENGIESYFSGCLTLTLGRKYRSVRHTDKVYFVDPYIPREESFALFTKDLIALFFSPLLTYHLSHQLYLSPSKLTNIIRTARFVRLYSRIFTKETLRNATYISQENKYFATLDNNERLNKAELLIKEYAQASFVVTKRIHCALPCLGLETPVYFTENALDNEVSSCRFGGIKELFNRITVFPDGIETEFERKGKLSNMNIVMNKDTWRPLAATLTQRCIKFILS